MSSRLALCSFRRLARLAACNRASALRPDAHSQAPIPRHPFPGTHPTARVRAAPPAARGGEGGRARWRGVELRWGGGGGGGPASGRERPTAPSPAPPHPRACSLSRRFTELDPAGPRLTKPTHSSSFPTSSGMAEHSPDIPMGKTRGDERTTAFFAGSDPSSA